MVAFFKKDFKTYNLKEKQKVLFLFRYYDDEIMINTETPLLNILQNVAIYVNILFRTLLQFLEIVHIYTTGQIKFPCVA